MVERRFKRALFIFRRDLRLDDNTALLAACRASERVATIFILDPRQVEPHPYRSRSALQFMCTSLRELARDIASRGGSLSLHYGVAEEVVGRLLDAEGFDAVYLNRDYTPFSKVRDEALYTLVTSRGKFWLSAHDALLQPPGKVVKDDRSPYTVFTPFFKRASKEQIADPTPFEETNLSPGPLAGEVGLDALDALMPEPNSSLFCQGGRTEGLSLVKRIETLSEYNEQRDYPALRGTSGLSSHHKFGTVSIRESYAAARRFLQSENRFITELFWRDFFTHIAFHFPHVFRGAFQKKYDAVGWSTDNERLTRWQEGTTGFPIVDAGMRELAATGYMHNRVRMIVASFLTKDLHLHWQLGEKHFAQLLVDYDPAVNNGSWQWASSTGCDAQPYFRIFNPWLQQERFDKECIYITRWVPELAPLSPSEIHSLHSRPPPRGYPTPIVDHAEAKAEAEGMFAEVAKASG